MQGLAVIGAFVVACFISFCVGCFIGWHAAIKSVKERNDVNLP